MDKSKIVWFHFFLIAFPTTLLVRHAEAFHEKGLIWDLLRANHLGESLRMKDVFDADVVAKFQIGPLVQYFGYPIETHRFYSSDGYLTTLHRIPHGRNSTKTGGVPVLLQHGVLNTGISWLHADENSLPFLLADRGFDVFIASQRGSGYSMGHKTLNISERAYWNFGLDEVATIEIPAFVDYILNITGAPKINYVGYSLGTMLLFAFLSAKPEYNDKIDKISLMGVCAYLSQTRSPIAAMLEQAENPALKGLMDMGFAGGFSVPNLINILVSPVCKPVLGPLICGSTGILAFGDNVTNSNYTRVGRIIAHSTHMSGKIIYQMVQLIKTGRIARFDYGPQGNTQIYGTPVSPDYDLKNVRRPVQAFTAAKDNIATSEDAYKTLKEIGPYFVNKETSLVKDPKFGHIDYMIHDNIYNLVYKPLLDYFLTDK